ncbi:hypothetical protein ACLOJK_004729 [Asimina triloba]
MTGDRELFLKIKDKSGGAVTLGDDDRGWLSAGSTVHVDGYGYTTDVGRESHSK